MSRAARVLALLLYASAAPALAVPDLSRGIDAGPLVVYPDDRRADRFYYPPGDLVFATNAEGRPEFKFFQMAYSGTAVSGDRGVILHRNTLSLGVEMVGPSPEDVRAARAALRRRNVDLRPMPIQKLEAALVYAGAGSEEEQALPAGHFESEGGAVRATFWTERTYNLRLDNATAELFWDAMHEGRGVISIAYAFVTLGLPPEKAIDEITGSPKLVEAIEEKLGKTEGQDEAEVPVVVKAGASSLHVDAERWPDLFRRLEFSGNVPPGYALLDVRCYDFSDGTRPDLYERRLEIDAEGVGGQRVRLETTFGDDAPDLYARSLRFPFAVRLDRPFRYRVTELTHEGEENVSEWQEADSWSRMLDITSEVASLADYRKSLDEDEDQEDED